MSNWNGVGTPENGQACRHLNWAMPIKLEYVGEKYFIARTTDLIGEVHGLINELISIKSPEEVERERVIDEMLGTTVLNSEEAVSIYDAGYRKIKPLSFEQYQKIEMIGHYKTTYRALVEEGYIIEKKEWL